MVFNGRLAHDAAMTIALQVLPVLLAIGFCALLACAAWTAVKLRGSQRRPWLVRLAVGLAVWVLAAGAHYFLIAYVYLPAMGRNARSTPPGTLVRVGERAPDFQLATVEGRSIGQEELRGHVVVINFFATWCGPCLLEMPQLESIWIEFKANTNFVVVCVARQESNETVTAFRRKHGFTLPMAADPTGSVYGQFATNLIPRTFLVGRDGTVLFQWTGNYPKEMAKLKTLIRNELNHHE